MTPEEDTEKDTEKDTLRHEAKRHRDRIDPFSEDPDAVCDLFFDKINPEKEQVVALYWPKGREFDPGSILERLLKEDWICVLPVVRKETKALGFVRWSDGQPLKTGPFGIEEPLVDEQTEWLAPDIIIVPMLAFDRKGHRLGYGGGYYDATLTALQEQKEVLAVGVAYAQQAVLFNLPVEAHDVKLDWLITPQGATCFKKVTQV